MGFRIHSAALGNSRIRKALNRTDYDTRKYTGCTTEHLNGRGCVHNRFWMEKRLNIMLSESATDMRNQNLLLPTHKAGTAPCPERAFG